MFLEAQQHSNLEKATCVSRRLKDLESASVELVYFKLRCKHIHSVNTKQSRSFIPIEHTSMPIFDGRTSHILSDIIYRLSIDQSSRSYASQEQNLPCLLVPTPKSPIILLKHTSS